MRCLRARPVLEPLDLPEEASQRNARASVRLKGGPRYWSFRRETDHVSLACVFRKAGPDGQGPLWAAALSDRAEPRVAPGRGADERGRLRDRLVQPIRAGHVQEHGTGMERPQPA